jgi:hypothetical protein
MSMGQEQTTTKHFGLRSLMILIGFVAIVSVGAVALFLNRVTDYLTDFWLDRSLR